MIIDIIVLAVLLISAVVSFLRGFIREVLTILGVAGGVVAMIFVGPLLAPLFEGWLTGGADGDGASQRLFNIIPYTFLADGLAYGGVFLLVVIILSVVSHYLSEGAKEIGLGAVDRTLGVIFGLGRGVVLLALLYLPFYLLMDKDDRDHWLDGSKSGAYVEMASSALAGMLPDNLASGFQENSDADDEDSLVKSTRQRLQEIDVLRVFPEIKGDKTDEKTSEGTDESSPSYQVEERQEIDNLISNIQEGLNE